MRGGGANGTVSEGLIGGVTGRFVGGPEIQPESCEAVESKLAASTFMQPTTTHEPSSASAEGLKFVANASVQPRMNMLQLPSE